MVFDQVFVRVPVVVVMGTAGVKLNEAHASFHEPASEQAALPEIPRPRIINAVKFSRSFRFVSEIDSFGSVPLHGERQLVARSEERRVGKEGRSWMSAD